MVLAGPEQGKFWAELGHNWSMDRKRAGVIPDTDPEFHQSLKIRICRGNI